MMFSGSLDVDEDVEAADPLSSGAAAPPPVIGGGCLARFDPQSLNDECGADFTPETDAH